jgi:hypothetical protein
MSNAQAVVERMDAPVPEQPSNALTPMDMVGRAVASGASIEVVEKLMALHERWEANQARKAFDEAMSAAKAEIPVIFKSRDVDFTSAKGRTHYRYEDLAEIARTVNPILGRHGLSYRFRTTSTANEPVTVTCIVSHRLGYSEENTLCAGRDESGNKNSIQAVGSTLTYLQRMTLKAALGLAASSDDDGRGSNSDETGELISEEQRNNLLALIDEVGGTADVFCKYFKIDSVAGLPASQFARAVKALEAKRAK